MMCVPAEPGGAKTARFQQVRQTEPQACSLMLGDAA